MEGKMKRKILFTVILIAGVYGFSQKIYDDFYKFKAELYNTEIETIQNSLENYKNKIAAGSLTPEEQITLKNFITLEEINVLSRNKDSADKKKIYIMLKSQNDESIAFMEGKKKSDLGKWFLLSLGDIKSRFLQFLSEKKLFTEAHETQQFYLNAIKKDKKFSPAHLSYGLWLFFAPPIVGGGYENALKEFSKAVSSAKNNYEKYQTLIYRSQVYFALDNIKASEADLKNAKKLIPNEIFTDQIKELNKNDKIFFEQ